MKKDRYKPLQPGQPVPLDRSDREILRILQRDNRLTNLELAESVHLSPPTCLRRVQRLQDEGVIVRHVSLIDPFKIGKGLIVITKIVLESTKEAVLVAFESKIRSDPAVLQCYGVAGDTDYLLVLCMEDMSAYLAFVRRTLVVDESIRRFESMFVLERTKFGNEIPID
ncbi:MAG: Lrp/AsnC family transcriptional regulator [Alphaproteobacteria bacterium]